MWNNKQILPKHQKFHTGTLNGVYLFPALSPQICFASISGITNTN